MTVSERVRKIVAENLGVDLARVTFDASLTDLGADSLDNLELVVRIEEEFDIAIPDDEADQARTVGDIIQLVEAHELAH